MAEDTLSLPTAQHSFNQFNSGNFRLNHSRHSARAAEVNVDLLKHLIEEDLRMIPCCLAERLRCSHTTVETHLTELGKDVQISTFDGTSVITASRLILDWH